MLKILGLPSSSRVSFNWEIQVVNSGRRFQNMKKQSVPSSLTQAFKETRKSEIINSNMLRREQETKKADFQVKTSRKLQKYELN